uniref:Cytochrome c oxidase assembly protein COX16 homolog, mitochondrial n=1 Tax=Eptatretus burgeri TaxID=7764 RepID=A0A8C4R0T7_EPTBU
MNLKAFFRGKTFRYGIPMLVLIIGGSAGLKEFTTIRYEAMARRTKIDPGLDALFDKTKRKTTLEAHYECQPIQEWRETVSLEDPTPCLHIW